MQLRKLFILTLLVIAFVFALSLSQQELTTVSITQAQSNAAVCDQVVQSALDVVANSCLNIGRNEICYGNAQVSATLTDPDDPNLFFEAPGDIVPLTALEAVITRPVDLDSQEWGIALMDLAADLPNGDDSVRLVLFGDVEVNPVETTLIENVPTCSYTNTASQAMNLRAGPGSAYGIVDVLDRGDSVTINGQDSAGEWVRSSRGWVYGPFGTLDCGDSSLRTIEDTDDTYVAPMQSFTLQISEDAQCETAPSGLLVQAPTGQTANIRVNNIELRVGSTAFIGLPLERSEHNDAAEFIVANIQGDVQVTRSTRTQPLVAGSQIAFSTDDEGNSRMVGVRTPFDASAYHLDDLLSTTLPTSVAAPPPLAITSNGGSGGGNNGGGGSSSLLAVPNVRCNVGQNPGSAAQYFSGNNATIVSFQTTGSGSAATITYETQVTDNSISYIFSCNAAGVSTFTTTITDSNGQTLSDSFTVTVH